MAACGGMGSICISVWDPDSSGFSLHPDLLHSRLTVYCPLLTLSQLRKSITPAGPHAHTWHTQTEKHTGLNLGRKLYFRIMLTRQTTAPSSHEPHLCFKRCLAARPLHEMSKNSLIVETNKPTRNILAVIGSLRPDTHQPPSLISDLSLRHRTPPEHMCQETDWCSFQMQFPAIKHFVMIKSD